MKHDVKTFTRVEHVITLSSRDVFEWLVRRGEVSVESLRNDRGRITIDVPTGGDYSGTTLDLDDVGGLTVRWTEVVDDAGCVEDVP